MKFHIIDRNGIQSSYELTNTYGIIAVQFTKEDFKNINNMNKKDTIYAEYNDNIFTKNDVEEFLKNIKRSD